MYNNMCGLGIGSYSLQFNDLFLTYSYAVHTLAKKSASVLHTRLSFFLPHFVSGTYLKVASTILAFWGDAGFGGY